MPPFYLLVCIAFFQNVRRTLPLLHQYRPHLVADNGGEYLGVEFFAERPRSLTGHAWHTANRCMTSITRRCWRQERRLQ